MNSLAEFAKSGMVLSPKKQFSGKDLTIRNVGSELQDISKSSIPNYEKHDSRHITDNS